MPQLLTRAPSDGETASGLLRAEHFQMAYVTNDIDRACALFGEQLGIRYWACLDGTMPAGAAISTRLAWVGTLMYEIICASGPGSAIYSDWLPQGSEFGLRHHHLGFLIHDQAQWDGVLANAAQHGWAVPYRNVNSLTEVCFVAVPELPHYLEYLYANPAGLEFFAGVPRN